MLALSSCRIGETAAWESIEDGRQLEILQLVLLLVNTSDQTVYTFAAITTVQLDPGSTTLRVNCSLPPVETDLDAEIVRRLGVPDTIPIKPKGELRLPLRLRRFYYPAPGLPAIDVWNLRSIEVSSAVDKVPLRPKLKNGWQSLYDQTRDWGETLHLACRITHFRARPLR